MKYFFASLFLCYSLLGNSQATNYKKPETHWDMFKYDVGNMFGGMGYSFSRPLHWKKNDWGNLGIIAAGTGAIYLIEEPASDYARRIKDDIPKSIREYGKEVGSPSNNYLITGAIYATGLVTKNEKLRRTGVLLISSASAAGVLQQVMKSAVGRARPLSDLSNDTFNPLWSTGNKDFHSFPSGHAILAMTNAHAIAKQFKNGWIKGGVYTLGAIPGISRLWEGKHWVSDIVLGWAISILTVESIDRYLDKKYEEKYNDSNKKLSWNLNFGAGQMGVVVQF